MSLQPGFDDYDKCARCGHASEKHSHDDEKCLSTHPQPCSLLGTLDAQRGAPLAPFRCRACGCPDFVRAALLDAPPPDKEKK